MTPLRRRFAYGLLTRALKRAFRRLVWVGEWNPPTADGPVVLYGNHHAFYDAQIFGFVAERVLGRHTLVWMEDLDRAPFLSLLGARTFPRDDGGRRLRTIRETQRLFEERPDALLIYFPEGELRTADDGIRPFPTDRCTRIAGVLPTARWWPVALRIAGWHDATPTAFLTGGPIHERPDGQEQERLTELVQRLTDRRGDATRVLLEGRPGPHERWDLSPIARWFYR